MNTGSPNPGPSSGPEKNLEFYFLVAMVVAAIVWYVVAPLEAAKTLTHVFALASMLLLFVANYVPAGSWACLVRGGAAVAWGGALTLWVAWFRHDHNPEPLIFMMPGFCRGCALALRRLTAATDQSRRPLVRRVASPMFRGFGWLNRYASRLALVALVFVAVLLGMQLRQEEPRVLVTGKIAPDLIKQVSRDAANDPQAKELREHRAWPELIPVKTEEVKDGAVRSEAILTEKIAELRPGMILSTDSPENQPRTFKTATNLRVPFAAATPLQPNMLDDDRARLVEEMHSQLPDSEAEADAVIRFLLAFRAERHRRFMDWLRLYYQAKRDHEETGKTGHPQAEGLTRNDYKLPDGRIIRLASPTCIEIFKTGEPTERCLDAGKIAFIGDQEKFSKDMGKRILYNYGMSAPSEGLRELRKRMLTLSTKNGTEALSILNTCAAEGVTDMLITVNHERTQELLQNLDRNKVKCHFLFSSNGMSTSIFDPSYFRNYIAVPAVSGMVNVPVSTPYPISTPVVMAQLKIAGTAWVDYRKTWRLQRWCDFLDERLTAAAKEARPDGKNPSRFVVREIVPTKTMPLVDDGATPRPGSSVGEE